MELLTIILLIIVGILAFLLLKKEKVLGIKTDENKTEEQVKVIESKDYRKNIYDLLNYIPEGIIILDKSKKIIMDGVEREVVEWKKEFITFHENEISKQVTEITGTLPILDRITGYFSQKTKCTVVDGTKF